VSLEQKKKKKNPVINAAYERGIAGSSDRECCMHGKRMSAGVSCWSLWDPSSGGSVGSSGRVCRRSYRCSWGEGTAIAPAGIGGAFAAEGNPSISSCWNLFIVQ